MELHIEFDPARDLRGVAEKETNTNLTMRACPRGSSN